MMSHRDIGGDQTQARQGQKQAFREIVPMPARLELRISPRLLCCVLPAAALACSEADDLTSLTPQALGEETSSGEQAPGAAIGEGGRIDGYERSIGSGNLSPSRREELRERGREFLASLGRARPTTEATSASPAEPDDDTQPPAAPVAAANEPSSPQGSDDISGSGGVDDESVEALWNDFLSAVHETQQGRFFMEDVSFAGEAELLEYFSLVYADRIDKGLTVPALKWPGQLPSLTVCWAPSWSNAAIAEMERVEELIQNTWARVVDVEFDFRDGSNNLRFCQETQCGFFMCPSGSEDIRIGQHSSITRGCSVFGTQAPPASCPNLPGTSDYYPSLALPTGSSGWVDQTIVHEFGHHIAFLHEHIRSEYPWRAGAGNSLWCQAADTDITLDPNSTPGNPNDDTRLNEVNAGGTAVGSYDPASVMNYCAFDTFAEQSTYAAELSVGDLLTARSMYQSQFYPVKVRHSSWYDTQFDVVLDLFPATPGNNGALSVTAGQTPGTATFGSQAQPGDDYTVTIGSGPTDSRLACTVNRPRAQGVFGYSLVVSPFGFDDNPVTVTCYDPAAITALL
jgi:hypothetical protein